MIKITAKQQKELKTDISKKVNTNSNIIRGQIKEHILAQYSLEELKEQIKAFKHIQTNYNRLVELVQGGCFLCYYTDIKEFLNGLGINKENKEYSDDKSWELYKHLIAINGERMLKDSEV